MHIVTAAQIFFAISAGNPIRGLRSVAYVRALGLAAGVISLRVEGSGLPIVWHHLIAFISFGEMFLFIHFVGGSS